jgi:hypothetical protein
MPIEGWSAWDALYMTIITMTTAGSGSARASLACRPAALK